MASIPGNDFNGWREKPSVNFHLLQFTRVLRVLLGGEVTIKRQFSSDIYLTCKKSQSDNFTEMCFCLAALPLLLWTPHKSLKGIPYSDFLTNLRFLLEIFFFVKLCAKYNNTSYMNHALMAKKGSNTIVFNVFVNCIQT